MTLKSKAFRRQRTARLTGEKCADIVALAENAINVSESMSVRVCVCVRESVCEREWERVCACACVCVCVCVSSGNYASIYMSDKNAFNVINTLNDIYMSNNF